jgi:hypothetical protein
MSIIALYLNEPHPFPGPVCEECGGRTRLTGIEPHPTHAKVDLRTYECIACEAVQAVQVPLT